MILLRHWKAVLILGVGSGLFAQLMVWLENLSPPYIPAWTGIIFLVLFAVLGAAYCTIVEEYDRILE
jgi:hypothetical protein